MVVELKKQTPKPVCVGFGVSTSEQANTVAHLADGVIVGSAIVNIIESHLGDEAAILSNVKKFAEELAAGVRGEIEFAYRTFAIDKISNLRLDDRVVPGPFEAGGDVTSFSVMGNIVSSLPLGPLNFYVGGGIGIARVEAEWRSLAGVSFPEVDDREDVFAWQLFTGLQYHLLEDLSAALGYRYFAADDSRLRRAGAPAGSHSRELSITH